MIPIKDISSTLIRLEKLYNSCSSAREKTLYSKLAIMELCGWIEQSMDKIADAFLLKRLSKKEYRKIFISRKKENNGFTYDGHFKKMLYETIGIHNLEKFESKIKERDMLILKAALLSLHKARNDAAHTRTTALSIYNAPSATIASFAQLKAIFLNFHEKISLIS